MKKVNPLKLTLVVIPIAIVMTFVIRYLANAILGNTIHPAFTLVTYIVLFAVLKIVGEKIVRGGKFPWLLSEQS